jgi:hypothetical protein
LIFPKNIKTFQYSSVERVTYIWSSSSRGLGKSSYSRASAYSYTSSLFGGGNDANVPPTGGIEQPPAATTQPTPGSGNVLTEGGSAEQPLAPQDDQDGSAEGGLPTIKNKEIFH